ncbi:uncharacterized protein LOC109819660 [Asparagus officinalis]|uniref:uncharacterized protein LOC109819660 n=1 Tax=Asparagus officinalis TaxID=4686 RepID=UPI00098E246B|nr:uncharacterized protein LOC109819660 [Asparagus officinalis]XP_020241063.1 uncharacterized protein LOC109819660 [Asparagus officinalis]
MAKKSHKRSTRPKKDNAGCMSGFISMFDFRQGRFTRKLLSDRKHGSSRHAGTVHSRNKFEVLSNLDERNENVSDIDAKEVRKDDSIKASVKALMAEEMSTTCISKEISDSSIEEIRTKLDFGDDHENKHKRKHSQNYKVEHSANDSRASESSSFDVNLAELMVELCREKHIESNGDIEPDSKLTQKHYILQKALSDITESFLTRDSVNSKQISCHGDDQSKEFMNALEMLNSNKDIFLKLLQDPNSLLFKHFLDIQNAKASEILHEINPAESINSQQPHKQTKHHFFRKRDKTERGKPSNENNSQDLKRIVVLKPGPVNYEGYSSTINPISSPRSLHNTSHFSFKEIKRRLRNVIGDSKKERNLIAMDGILHKVPYGSQNSNVNNKSSKLSSFLNGGDNDAKLKQHKLTGAHPLHRESVFYEEAKKRLAEMLSADAHNEISSPRASKSLGRILSLPGYSSFSPRFSPGREKELSSPAQMRSSPLQKIKQDDSSENSPRIDRNPDDQPQVTNSISIVAEVQMHIEEDLVQKGSTKTDKSEGLDIQLELSTDEFDCNSEDCNKEEGSLLISDLGPSEEAMPLTPCISVSPNSIPLDKFEVPESNAENLDRPSPVSVLDPFFSEDINSPEQIETNHELTAEPRRLYFEENVNSQLILTSTKQTKLMYVRTVLDASGLNCDKLQERWQLSDQLLDPFVFDEVEISYGQVIDDSKLLFDCINEVLVEMRDRYLSCSPWIFIIKPNIRPAPIGEKFIQEVCNLVDRHLERVSPYTLDCVVRKDLEVETWMNVGLESEAAVFEIEEVILNYIMEETILELWD